MVGVPLRYFSNADVAPHGVGRRFRARLHEVGRIVDHRGHVALVGAAEIVVRLVLVVALVLVRRAEILRPQAAGAGDCRDFRIVEPDRRDMPRIAGWYWRDADCARRHAGGREHRLDLAQRILRGARVRRADRHVDDDGAGALAQPVLRHAHDVGALAGGHAAAAVADEHHDRVVGLLHRDRMAQAIIVRIALGGDDPRSKSCRRRA